MKFLDRDHPFFARPWIRWLSVLFPLIWGGVELWVGLAVWGVLLLVLGVWAAWELLIRT